MPSSATITAFWNFTGNTRARASQVNTNFDTFRGHIIPVDPNTAAAASTNIYDLGETSHRWRSVYTKEIDFMSNTTTGNTLKIYGDTTSSGPAFIFAAGGAEVFRVRQLNQTTSADSGTYISGTTTVLQVTNQAVTITTFGGPVFIVPYGDTTTSLISAFSGVANQQAGVIARILRDSTIVANNRFTAPAGVTTTSNIFLVSPNSLWAIDIVPAGTYVYSLHLGTTSNTTITATNIKLRVMER